MANKNSFAANRFKEEEINDALQKIFFIIKDRILGRFPSIGPTSGSNVEHVPNIWPTQRLL